MPYFEVTFIDGTVTTIEADAYPEQRDDEWVCVRDGEIAAQYQRHEVRGIQKYEPPQCSPGGAY